MLVPGDNDNDVPIIEAEQFYVALKDVGVETVMVRYRAKGIDCARRSTPLI
jgi:dipeptidyl aminopeptidase/acylaminoacyl peptidase